MTDHLDIDSVFSKLKLPLKDIELLTFCTSNKAAKVTGWANSLKTTQTVQTCGLLYQAIPQVNRLKVSYVERKAMLDSLFLVAYPCTQTLSKEFLNQPIVLPEATQKLALVGQSILNSLATGYLMVLKGISEEKKIKGAQTKAASEAIYHGLQCLALMQLRNQQLYSQASRVIWRQANALVVLAQYFDVENTLVKPNLNTLQPSTPSHCFIRMVALAGAKTNQLTQLEIGNVFNAVEQWARAIDIDGDIPTFWIDSHSDAPPTLSHRQVPPSQQVLSLLISACSHSSSLIFLRARVKSLLAATKSPFHQRLAPPLLCISKTHGGKMQSAPASAAHLSIRLKLSSGFSSVTLNSAAMKTLATSSAKKAAPAKSPKCLASPI